MMQLTCHRNILIVAVLDIFVSVIRAETVTLFPSPFNTGNSLHGETGGTGDVGTTYILEGETAGIPFTATLVEGASELAETVNIPTLSVELAVGCIFSQPGESAICQSVIGSGTAKVTDFETVVFSPFPVAIGTDSAISGSGSASSVLSSSASASSASASSTPSSATGSNVSASTTATVTPTLPLSISDISTISASISPSTTSPSSATVVTPTNTAAGASSDGSQIHIHLGSLVTLVILSLGLWLV